jgi:hypothetical protein
MTYALRLDFPDNTILPGVPKGAVFIGSGTDPLVWVSNYGPEESSGVFIAGWNASQIAERINQVGIRGSGKDLNKVYYQFPTVKGATPAYTLGSATVEVGEISVKTPPFDIAISGTLVPKE